MILQVNNFTNFNSAAINTLSKLTHDTYPEQDPFYLGKVVKVNFYDGNLHYRYNLNQSHYPEYDGPNTEDIDIWWKIVRFDKDSIYELEEVIGEDIITDKEMEDSQTIDNIVYIPGTMILINKWGQVITGSTVDLKRMVQYPKYTLATNEVLLNIAETWDQFNNERKFDKIFGIHYPHKLEFIYKPVYTEYYKDILAYDSAVNRLSSSPDQHKTFEQIKEQLIAGNPDNEKLPDEILKSFPTYYPRHEHHILDIPRRAINSGVLIRCSERVIDDQPEVVVEVMEDGSYRYITGKEAFIYVETDTSSVDMNSLDLYNHPFGKNV